MFPATGDFLYVIIDTYDGILSNIQSYKIFTIQNYMDFEDHYIFNNYTCYPRKTNNIITITVVKRNPVCLFQFIKQQQIQTEQGRRNGLKVIVRMRLSCSKKIN